MMGQWRALCAQNRRYKTIAALITVFVVIGTGQRSFAQDPSQSISRNELQRIVPKKAETFKVLPDNQRFTPNTKTLNNGTSGYASNFQPLSFLGLTFLGLGLVAFAYVAMSPLYDTPTIKDVEDLLAQQPPRKVPPSLRRPDPIILALIVFISAVPVVFVTFLEVLRISSSNASFWSVLFISVPFVLVGIGVPFAYKRIVRSHMDILRNGLLARGKVVGSKIEAGKGAEGESRDYYYIAIEFFIDKNKTRREWISVNRSFQKESPVGTEINVLHVPKKKKIILPEIELVLRL